LSYSDFERPIQDKLFTTINILIENNYIPWLMKMTRWQQTKFSLVTTIPAALTVLLKVDILIIATNTNGIYTSSIHRDPKLSLVNRFATNATKWEILNHPRELAECNRKLRQQLLKLLILRLG
jgi:hypothetical protein